ncbi:cobalt-precorrin 5A hydrolase [Candidatus Marinarcus aquaticus]|uniref:Cobalamin biosynthesis protein CbiG n=1 Tax=Candidatus Marinarcus aquaticus TaxID=2044504 RepID=A0A4Q0XNJ5_9BACT|nr:cobalamin biosynthesis protein [Candidatus Marinarcus aquaticus]RXJ54096.1 cobalamin biosynthesis protein CbiG [Candidatus Marinarcus aquaticus]
MKIAIISINQPSYQSALTLASYLDEHEVDIYAKEKESSCLLYEKVDDIFKDAWNSYDAFICIMATGIVVRKIAPFLQNKAHDPAVLVMSIDLLKVMPLLSGHLGGANELGTLISKRIKGCINFVTTATDQMKVFAFDMFAKKYEMNIENLDKLAHISNRLINQKRVKVATYDAVYQSIENTKNLERISFDEVDENSVLISAFGKVEQLHLKPMVFLGIGCNRGTTCGEIEEAFTSFLQKHSLHKEQIKSIASYEAKKDEQGLLEFALKHQLEITFFNEKDINTLEGEFSPSQAQKFFNLKGVAEPSSILISIFKELVLPKEIYNKKITIAGAI